MKNIVFILTGDLQSSIDWVIFPEVVFSFPKKVGFNYAFFQSYYNYFYRTLAPIHSCSGIVHFSDVKVCNYPLLLTHFFSVYFRIPVTVKKNYLLQQLYFQSRIIETEMREATWSSYFFAKRFFSEYLVAWKNCFLTIISC